MYCFQCALVTQGLRKGAQSRKEAGRILGELIEMIGKPEEVGSGHELLERLSHCLLKN